MSRHFNHISIDKDCSDVSGFHSNEVFFNCKFNDLRGLTLKDCDLNRSQFLTEDIRKALGFTLTLDCHSFNDVEYSEVLFDLLLFLVSTTKGNDEKRKAVETLLGHDKVVKLRRLLKTIES